MPELFALVLRGVRKVMRVQNSRRLRLLHLWAAWAVAVMLVAAVAGCGDEATPFPTPSEIARQTAATGTTTFHTPTIIPAEPTPVGVVPLATVAGRHKVEEATAIPTEDSSGDRGHTDTFPTPPERDFYKLAKELLPEVSDVNPVVREQAETLQVGHRKTLNLVDLDEPELYQGDFVLRLVTPNAYWFVEDGLEVDQDDLEYSAREFEDEIYPMVTAVYGSEWKPGVDGDPHLYVLNASLKGVGGYYSAADEYPKTVRPVSNEIEAIYINVRYLKPGTVAYANVLAHELQHAVHWNTDRSEDTWVNEGLSELAVTIAGQPQFSMRPFQRAGPTSLTIWPASDIGGAEHYGAASLFMHYFSEHYAGRTDLRPLISVTEDDVDGINVYLEHSGFDVRFTDVFQDWAVANLLDEDGGPYGYSDMNVNFPVYESLKIGNEYESTIPQFANEYVRLERSPSPVKLLFEGDTVTPLLPEELGEGCWWSNRGDVIDSTLTSTLDLDGVEGATLDYELWYSIEEDWDFTYLEVSVDDGETWTILETPLTSSEDPLDVSFGPGYTGSSDGWQDESVSLDQWGGQQVMLRLQYITDASIHDHGLCVRNLQVSSAGEGLIAPLELTPNGFAWTTNRVRQDFMVQVVYEGEGEEPNRVLSVRLDEGNRGEIALEPDREARRVVAIVQTMAPATRLPATYKLRLEPAE